MIRPEGLALPVAAVVPALLDALAGPGCAVLAAPPGTGKTTLVPLLLAGAQGRPAGRVLVAEPRRMAARAAARRMAWLLGEPVGRTAGFTVRGERRVSPATQVEVVTTGVLLQRLQRDPELAGVGTVVLDECHERHLDADTAMAFLLDVRATLRPELRLVAASATTDTAAWAALLDAPVVEAADVLHPVAVRWAPPPRQVRPPHGMHVDPALLAHVAAVVRTAVAEDTGDVLCFLPGVGEIARVAGMLSGLGVDVLQLHGRAPAAAQDAALAPGQRRRVLLATSVAESSLTVPGVRTVVDSGLTREPRMDHARGLGSLTTVRVSRAAAEQRAGRAGREAPGTVHRCWAQGEHDRLARRPAPEIALADLTGFALQAACWGEPDVTGLALLDPPPPGAMAAARATLRTLGAVDAEGRATARGRRLGRLGLHPRLARALLDAAPVVGTARAAELTALLSEEVPAAYGADLTAAWHTARRAKDAYAPRWRAESHRLSAASTSRDDGPAAGRGSSPEPGGISTESHRPSAASTSRDDGPAADRNDSPEPGGIDTGSHRPSAASTSRDDGPAAGRGSSPEPGGIDTGSHRPSGGLARGRESGGLGDDAAAGLVVALAFPERVARRRPEGGYLMVSGTGAEVGGGLGEAEWVAVAVADRGVGRAAARVRLAAVVDEETAREAAAWALERYEEVRWAQGDVVARRVERLGAVELSAAPLREPDPAAVQAALLDGLATEGTGLLRWSRDAGELRQRMAFVHRVLGPPWPDVAEDALLDRAGEWLGPELARARRRADLARIDAGAALPRLLPWATGEAARFAELAPERIEVPSGSRIRVDYGGEQPVLAVKLQELFGLAESPRVAGVPVLVHLLSPAGRPAAVTADLASFWREGYRAVRAELRGRYPRHPWPEDPSTAAPTRRTNARRG
ncbi:ATP-dependent RNA helicase [Actinacidiphila bryophytorum]|uniref:ATP-dependent RNA helicase n=2 Tax=Actinacidiphila bryophytorum TaxID=1436133 RepID=UPI00196142C8|nr:ATP-dependent helicase C-terminal domain-containing protein [Actinacidiphila bryophytorum]MBM9436183.1 ATP-dependent helicase [Actinacidiphila bryophytorum]